MQKIKFLSAWATRVFALTGMLSLFYQAVNAQQPSVALFEQVFNAKMQKLLPSGFARRTVSFVQVIPGTPNGGYYPFKVTAYVHDYSAGYPANKYYGETCLGKMDGWKFDLLKDEFGEWIVQGRFTVSNANCKRNPAEGVESIPLATVPGTPYKQGNTPAAVPTKDRSQNTASQLYIGQYACYGTGGRLMAGMGFYLLANGTYYDLDKQRKGTYAYDAKAATLSFRGGFLSGIVVKHVTQTGFQLSNTVRAEPWR